jgi:hypothetical protein
MSLFFLALSAIATSQAMGLDQLSPGRLFPKSTVTQSNASIGGSGWSY